MKANRLLAENITTLLKGRGQKQKDLADWCGHSQVWIGAILSGKRDARLQDIDRMADFFGIATYQLFQPGISTLTERRLMERRAGRERRIGYPQRGMHIAERDIYMHRHSKKDAHVSAAPPPTPAAAELKRAIADFERRANDLLVRAEAGGQAASPRGRLTATPPRRRAAGRSDPPKV